jgi:hypothetical protein
MRKRIETGKQSGNDVSVLEHLTSHSGSFVAPRDDQTTARPRGLAVPGMARWLT